MLALTAALAISGALLSPLAAQSFSQVSGNVDQKLEAALQELSSVRSEIAEKKKPLSTDVAKLESEVLELRREYDRLLKLKDSRTINLTSLENQVKQMKDQADFVNSRLREFIDGFEQRVDHSELPLYEEMISEAKLAPKDVNMTEEQKRDVQFDVIEAALQRMENLVGGHTYQGKALNANGEALTGSFAQMGPTVFFTNDGKSAYGMVETQLNAPYPVIVTLPENVAGGIPGAITSGKGELPFDATLGKALKVTKAQKDLMGYVEDGGEVGYVIIALGVVGILLALFKCFQIIGFKVAMPRDIDAILADLDKGDTKSAQQKANNIGGTAGEMLAAGVVNAEEKRGILEEMMFERILKARPYLESFLPFLAITAAAAPLLGLLGTVIGMIKTFQLITIFGTGDAKSLSSGISEALVTTALGLIVAIPTLILHGMLSRMAKRKLGLLEQGAVAFVNGIVSHRHEPKLEEKSSDKADKKAES